MDIIDITDVDLSVLERTNPVFNTAKMTLFDMANAGDEDARAISEALGLTQEETQNSRTVVATPAQVIASTLTVETRFRTMGEMAARSGCATVVDLPCGYTPRAIQFARKGVPYVGLDLPAAILEAKPAIMSLVDEDKRQLVRYFGVDATNFASLKEVFDQIEGSVCITTEGLLMYLTDSETGQLCDGIRTILAEHGGCWLLADAEVALQFTLTARAFYGDRFMEAMMRGKERASKKSDFDVKSRTLPLDISKDVNQSMRAAMASSPSTAFGRSA